MSYPGIIIINCLEEAKVELEKIGVQAEAVKIMSPKALFKAVKVCGVSSTAANIIKQEMLSRGGEVAVAHGVINHSVKTSDILIFGTHRQFLELTSKLRQHQFNLPRLGREIEELLSRYGAKPKPIKIGRKNFVFGWRTYVMGILNVTPDSFSDGGAFLNSEEAANHGLRLIEEGADILDIGGESTRPGAKKISVEEELARVLPVIKSLKKKTRIPVSIDTRRAKVAQAAIALGADLVNDVSGLRFDPQMAKVISGAKVPVCIMHMKGLPSNMQKKISYQNLMQEILVFLKESIEIARNAGILKHKIIIDPGIGFGKTVLHNLEILDRLRELAVLGQAILVGTSRKSFIGETLGLEADERVEGTAATVAAAIINGAHIVRVHDVLQMSRVAKMTDAIINKGGR